MASGAPGAFGSTGLLRNHWSGPARPGPHTPGEIAKDLGRSSGAVGNALTPLADRGEADWLPGKPVSYQANTATAAAAAAPNDLRHAAVSLWLNSGVPRPRSPAAPGAASPSW